MSAAAITLLLPKHLLAEAAARTAHRACIAELKSVASSEMSSPFAIRALARFALTKELKEAHEDVKVLREAIIKPPKEAPKPPAPAAAVAAPAAPAVAPPKPAGSKREKHLQYIKEISHRLSADAKRALTAAAGTPEWKAVRHRVLAGIHAAEAAFAHEMKMKAEKEKAKAEKAKAKAKEAPAAAPAATGGAGVAPAAAPAPKPAAKKTAKAAEAKALAVLEGKTRPADAAPAKVFPSLPRYDDEFPATYAEYEKMLEPLVKTVAPYQPRIDEFKEKHKALVAERNAIRGSSPAHFAQSRALNDKIDAVDEERAAYIESLPDKVRRARRVLSSYHQFVDASNYHPNRIAVPLRRTLRLHDEGGLAILADLPLKEQRTLISEQGNPLGQVIKASKINENLPVPLSTIPSKLSREEASDFLVKHSNLMENYKSLFTD